MHNKVFISYAKEDYEFAEQLFNFLELNQYDPWLDKKKLSPGQNWNTEIRLALKKADFIILLLSKISVAKRGFVQREFKIALEYYEEKLDTDIYIIPCKINDCEVPENLSKYQWVEINRPDSYDMILKSLNIQRVKYEEYERIRIAQNSTFEYSEISFNKTIKGNPNKDIRISYPKFIDINNEDLKLLNTYTEYVALKEYNEFICPFSDSIFHEDEVDDEFTHPDYELQLNYNVELLSRDFISYTIDIYTYTGGAHGNYSSIGYNYRLNPLIEFKLEPLLDYDTEVLSTLQSLCKDKLMKKAKEDFEIYSEDEFFFEGSLDLEWNTYENFYLTKDSIVVIFNPYHITAYAFGQHEVDLKFDEIISQHDNLKTLKKIKQNLNN